ncbi:MAG: zinc-binding alcohol dehydrogenase family protein [Candidatus Nitronauta litoralis]|uniref:Zinc-type alcohol dehydrogenase-like protein n=1 Tax=Candidatus Nitronauta litoralis TaxID=2705533 RepID=A0A7T0G0F0_9BACT|nr:MAG: zinc-binding alcohol dehydrogenase family protein [Candidatus Nitronauta litoralis]
MKAVGLYQYLPIENEQSLVDVEMDCPEPAGKDLLVKVQAISVNPVDTKVRAPGKDIATTPQVLGWDAAGEVIEVGPDVAHFSVGDKVFYAGDITRPGSNSEFQLVDERIVGRMPQSLSFEEAAALPLTGITAWEALFERLGISSEGKDAGRSILIIGGAGGVGSIAIQLAKKLAKLKVIATASRPESSAWSKKLGADLIVNHRNPLDAELVAIETPQVDFILCLNNTGQHWGAMAKAIAPQGSICSIVETSEPVELGLLKSKSASFTWEFMFTRSMFQTEDMIEQQKLLNRISDLVEKGELVTTTNNVIRPINASNLRKAHALIEQGATIGKIVLADWPEK